MLSQRLQVTPTLLTLHSSNATQPRTHTAMQQVPDRWARPVKQRTMSQAPATPSVKPVTWQLMGLVEDAGWQAVIAADDKRGPWSVQIGDVVLGYNVMDINEHGVQLSDGEKDTLVRW